VDVALRLRCGVLQVHNVSPWYHIVLVGLHAPPRFYGKLPYADTALQTLDTGADTIARMQTRVEHAHVLGQPQANTTRACSSYERQAPPSSQPQARSLPGPHANYNYLNKRSTLVFIRKMNSDYVTAHRRQKSFQEQARHTVICPSSQPASTPSTREEEWLKDV
jgi:hypothetical protein